MDKRKEKIKRRKWKAVLIAGAAILLSAVGVAAFQEVSVIYRAVSGKVAVHLEEYTVKNGEETKWTDDRTVMPGESISKIPRICNDGEPCYVRARVEFECDGEASVPLSVDNLEGISSQWIHCGDYFYYTQVLPKEGKTDFFKGIKVPEQWESGIDDGKSWRARVKVDAVQADFFQPDFSSDDPWLMENKGYRIQKAVDEKPESQQKDQEPVSLEVDVQMKGFQTDTREFFRKLETFVPGKTQTGTVTISNQTEKEREVFIKSEVLEQSELLEKLKLTIQVQNGNQMHVVYEGALQAANLAEYQSIGKISGESTENIEFLIHMPEEADNRYSAKQGKVKFTFTTEHPEQTAIPSAVKTGDQTPLWFYIGLAFSVSGLALLIPFGRKQKAERKRENGGKVF